MKMLNYEDFIKYKLNEQTEEKTEEQVKDKAEVENSDENNQPVEETEGNAGRELTGIPLDHMLKKIEKLLNFVPSDVQIGVPSDNLGHSTTYKDPTDAIQRLKDINYYYYNRGSEVKYYCRDIVFKGNWKAAKALENKIKESGLLYHINKDKYGDIDLSKVADYFKEHPEDSDNLSKVTISIDSNESDEYRNKELEKNRDEDENNE